MRALYTALKAQILAKAPSIKDVKLYNGQELNWSQESPMALPAVLIEFNDVTWLTIGNGYQEAEFTITTHLLTEILLEDEDNLEVFDIRGELHKALQGWQYGTSSDLDRVSENFDTSHDGLRIDLASYQVARYQETTSQPDTKQQVTASLELEADLIINNDIIRTGVEDGDKLKSEAGAYIVTKTGKTIKIK